MIPKTIHYCWFGRHPLPKSVVKCINSWKIFFPGYEIKEWNEDNFDVNIIHYTQEAYEAKKYAFVSDYARLWILYHYGGLYFDTDVEVIKPMDDIIERGPFMGVERNGLNLTVAPGLGLGAYPEMPIYKELLDLYEHLHFKNNNGTLNQKTIVSYTTEILEKHGLKNVSEIQVVNAVYIYPSDYFNPFDELTGRLHITENTRSIHWFMTSWMERTNFVIWLSRISHRVFGLKLHNILVKLRRNHKS